MLLQGRSPKAGRLSIVAAAVLATVGCSRHPDDAAKKPLAVEQAAAVSATPLTVTSAAFQPGGAIPKTYAGLGLRHAPPLAWSGVPARSMAVLRSFAVIVQDSDAPTPRPFVHWIVFNIPASTSSLAPGALPGGALEGHASTGASTWFGPAPPSGPPHHYHFQVFALDAMLPLKAGASRESVVDAMRGHVLASGEVVGLYKIA